MNNAFIKFIVDIMSNDAIAAVILIVLLSVWWLSWKFVINPLIKNIQKIGTNIEKHFQENNIEKMAKDIEKIKERQLSEKNIVEDINYITDFIKTNTTLINIIKKINENTSNIVLTKENLNSINQDLIYIKKYIDRNFDNHKELSKISDQIKDILKYIEDNKHSTNNMDSKYMETALKIILEGLGHQTRTRFEKID